MHRALLCRDIVAEIVRNLYTHWKEDEYVFLDLYNCAQVNKLFFSETICVLWQGCGNHTPGVRHLAQIARQDLASAQIYANQLTYLHFGFFEDGGKEGNYGPITFDTAYLDVLSSLKYPHLESITIYGTGEDIEDRQLECYLQSRLESFTLEGEFAGHLKTLLETVTQRCPDIKNVNIECKGSLTVHVGNFLEIHPQLNGFSLPPAQLVWSQEDFEPICQMTALRQLCIPCIEASWLDGTGAGWSELDQLRTTLSSEALGRLTELAPGLGIVELKLEMRGSPSPSDAFINLSQLTELRSLEVHLMRTDASRGPCIIAQDLVNLARNCPALFKFHISSERGHPAVHGLNDSLFGDLTSTLPEVSDFCLDIDDASALTFKAVVSLGQHCQKLWQAKLSCNVDWMYDLEAELSSGVQFTFSELNLVMCGERFPLERWTDANRERLSRFAEKFASLAPECSSIEILGGNDADDYVKNVLDECIDKREA
ncbi:uncharacterized protein CC84DRAFT_1166525 [Paraphaeosphaeria sporulosa]|uniref:F-box domain-containing protein n=1 Tax=Paraphaeosphaeria sporulosa TaxID=1460663 RepID=A0A177C5J2_9PLEO|nr:uncharacterized protein CC84DRAFT_1166525 [Paraphaeosphaeria sporulosa]OAG02696.1 hypothetical protein CC84DRAFT_1166525 [Paraphaeosphaeria sporulosa]